MRHIRIFWRKQNGMPFITNGVYVATVLMFLVCLAEWLGQRRRLRFLGSSLIVIIITAVVANMGLLPSSQQPTPLYDGIFGYAAPLAIFYLLLDVRLKDLRAAGLPMILLFCWVRWLRFLVPY